MWSIIEHLIVKVNAAENHCLTQHLAKDQDLDAEGETLQGIFFLWLTSSASSYSASSYAYVCTWDDTVELSPRSLPGLAPQLRRPA